MSEAGTAAAKTDDERKAKGLAAYADGAENAKLIITFNNDQVDVKAVAYKWQ